MISQKEAGMKDELDILKEVGSIAAGHGGIALSEILGTKIGLSIPSLDIIPGGTFLKKMPSEQVVISVSSHILSGLAGDIIFVMDEKSAFKLIDMCYRLKQEDRKSGVLTELGISVIKEVGSVVISSYIGALGIMLKTLIIPSIPSLVSGPIQQIISMALTSYSGEEFILLVEAIFDEPNEKIKGSFFLVLSPEAMKSIQDTCKTILASLEQKEQRK